MSWSITKKKPLAGVSLVGPDRVLIDLDEAFDAPPTFEQVARHVGISPERLLNDLVSVVDDKQLMAARIWVQRVVFQAIDPDGFGDFRMIMDEEPEVQPAKLLLDQAEASRRREIYGYEDLKPNQQTTRFPLWLVPTTAGGKSIVVPAPLSAATKDLISLRTFHWDDIHGYLEASQDEFDLLREESERLYIASKMFISLTRNLKERAGAVLQPINDLAMMIGNMLANTDPPQPHHAHADAKQRNRRVAAEVAADLHLGADLVTEHYFGSEDDPIGRKRASKFRIIKACLDTFPGEAASKLITLGDLAPPEVTFEYFRAMEACAAALSVADPDAARPLLEKHFLHALVSVADTVKPIDTGKLDGAKKELAEAVNSFDTAILKKLDKKVAFPALAVTVGPPTDTIAKGKEILDWAGKPAAIVGKLANYALVGVASGTFAQGSASAMMTRLALGVAGTKTVELESVLVAMLAQAAGEHTDQKDALAEALRREARKKIKGASESLKDRLTLTDDGVLLGMSSVRFLLDLASTLALFSKRANADEGWRSEDWLDAAKQVHSTAGSAAALIETMAARYGSAAEHALAIEKQGIHKLAEWTKIADSKVLPVAEVALGLWSARETQLKAMRWGHESDAGFEVLVVVVGLLKYVHPLAGFVATAVLGVVKVLKEIDGGSNGMHAYYEHQRAVIVERLEGMKGMGKVADRWLKRFEADNPQRKADVTYENWHNILDIRNVKDSTMTRMDRLYALVYTLNEWNGAMRPVSMPAFAVKPSKRFDVRTSLERQRFPEGAIELVLDD